MLSRSRTRQSAGHPRSGERGYRPARLFCSWPCEVSRVDAVREQHFGRFPPQTHLHFFAAGERISASFRSALSGPAAGCAAHSCLSHSSFLFFRETGHVRAKSAFVVGVLAVHAQSVLCHQRGAHAVCRAGGRGECPMALPLESSRHIPCAVSQRIADGTWNVSATLPTK